MLRRFRQATLNPVESAILSVLRIFRVSALRVFSKHQLLAGIYYCFFSRRFDREHLAVLRGQLAYRKNINAIGNSSPLLRRNIHRLEKGLIMKPRKDVFAENYILETIQCYKRALAHQGYSESELKWAKDVLDEYFCVVTDTEIIKHARAEYEAGKGSAKGAAESSSELFVPYPASTRPESQITFQQLSSLFARRRSVRWYLKKPVSHDLVQKCINLAATAPSACNRQPYRFIVEYDSKLAMQIAQCAAGTSGYAEQIPAIVVVVGDLSAYPYERDRHLIYIDSSLASMQLMLAAETIGLSTCPINWPDVKSAEERLQSMLKLPPYERVVMLIAIGYADPECSIAYSQKKQNALIINQRISD